MHVCLSTVHYFRCPICNVLTPCGSAAALKINFAMLELLQFTDVMAAEMSALAAGAVKPARSDQYAGQDTACEQCGE